jgi:non-homologous end joining protein Ku
VTLRYPYEVRKEDEYFEDIEDEKIPKDMMELASHIVKNSGRSFSAIEGSHNTVPGHYADLDWNDLRKRR